MANEVYLMRHGRTVLDELRRSDGWLDMPLSDDGYLGLIHSQQYLYDKPLNIIYTADLKRTMQTGEFIRSGCKADPTVCPDSRARTWNLGALSGTNKKYGRPEVEKLIKNPNVAPDGGESFNQFYDRFWGWFRQTIDSATEVCPILIVMSGSNLRLVGKMFGGDPEKVDMDEGGLAVLSKSGEKWSGKIIMNPNYVHSEVKKLS